MRLTRVLEPYRTGSRLAGAAPAVVGLLMGLLGAIPARAATPPATVNYQGVLRDQDDKPLTGTYDIVFRFMDAPAGGNEILVDQHAVATASAVAVTGGLFNVSLGSGTVSDGSGPGVYATLDAVFRDYGSVWLEVQVGAETLSPRTPIRSAPYALNTTRLDGQPADHFIDTSATEQSKNGRLTVRHDVVALSALESKNLSQSGIGFFGQGGAYGVQGNGRIGGQFLGSDYGVQGFGDVYAAGFFAATNSANGVFARGNIGSAGHFESWNSFAPSAELAYFNTGLSGSCQAAGGLGVVGSGERIGVTGTASGTSAAGAIGGQFTGNGAGSFGITASGVTAGQFTGNGTGSTAGQFTANGVNSTGVIVSGDKGGQFTSALAPSLTVQLASAGPGVAVAGATSDGISVASANVNGVRAIGDVRGGLFQGVTPGSVGVYATGDDGIVAQGNIRGGYFQRYSGTGTESATLASGSIGISATGPAIGAYFSNQAPYFSFTQIPYHAVGILAYGSAAGGEFRNFSTSNFAYVGYSSYKIQGSGAVSFVQNHPDDSSKVIVYTAPEGDEAAVYTRGSGRLADGEARVRLGETFALVANPDIGLTATATPRGAPIPLAVSAVSPGELVVRGPAGSDAEFDYMVWGLRIGFEEASIVQPKRDDAKIPSMHDHERIFEDEPALRRYTALARFKVVEEEVRGRKDVDLARAAALRGAIGVFAHSDPASGPHDGPRKSPVAPLAPPSGPASLAAPGTGADPSVASYGPTEAGVNRPVTAGIDFFSSEGTIDEGDVVSLVPASPGAVIRSAGPDDPLVIGCAWRDAGLAAGARAVAAEPGAPSIAVATSRVALCRADASNGAIGVGDRLSLSAAPGTAMRAEASTGSGTILGRAIDPLPSGTGLVRVLLESR
jgi:hypothetical protein